MYKKNGMLVFRVYDKDDVLPDECMGITTLPLSALHDQLPHDGLQLSLRSADSDHLTTDSYSAIRATGSILIDAQFSFSQDCARLYF